MSETHVIVGPAGVGKTTVAERVAEAVDGYERVEHGERIVEIARERGLIQGRRDGLELSQYVDIQRDVAAEIGEAFADVPLILDSRCAIEAEGGFLPGLSWPVLRELDPDILILIDAPADLILERRRNDTGGDRRLPSKTEIEASRETERQMAVMASVLSNSYLHVVENTGEVDAAVERVTDVIEA
jgi:adenylate kinase